MARVLYFDCFSGAAGDMILAALLDAGLPLDQLRAALGSLAVGHELRVSRVMRAGLSATYLDVRGEPAERDDHHHHHDHSHDHHHHHHRDPGHDHGSVGPTPPPSSHGHAHPHRSLKEIAQLIQHSALSASGKARAVAMFDRLGAAEAAIHDMPIDRVHLHEVGAVDSIIDIVGIVFAMEWFGIDEAISSPLNVGSGTVEIAHGTFPVPAPATLRLLAGAPTYSSGLQAELVTPTGALAVTTYASSFGPLPPMKVDAVGYGAGRRDFPHRPNVIRIVIGERTSVEASAGGTGADVVKIECEIDDMNPQLFAVVTDRLLEAGALDAYLTPIMMKKGRPGTLVTVLTPADRRTALCDLLFRETTTIGVRFTAMQRDTLDRRWVDVAIDGGIVRIKVAGRGGAVFNAVPEFEDCARVAAATGRPIKTIQAEAMRAWLERPSS